MSTALEILAVLALVGLNAYFVIGEYSVVTARRGVLAARAHEGSRTAAAALKLMDEPVRVISTVQVGITSVGILTGALGEPLVRDILGDGIPTWLGFLISFGIVTYLTVVFGELVPKALTLDRAERLAMLMAPSITLLAVAFRPLVVVLERSAAIVLRPFGIREVIAGEGVAAPRSCASSSTRPRGPASSPPRRRSSCTTSSTSPTRRRATSSCPPTTSSGSTPR